MYSDLSTSKTAGKALNIIGEYPNIIIVVAEIFILSALSSAQYSLTLTELSAYQALLRLMPSLVKAILVSSITVLAISWLRDEVRITKLNTFRQIEKFDWFMNASFFLALAVLMSINRRYYYSADYSDYHWPIIVSPAFWLGMLGSWARMILSPADWVDVLRDKLALVLALAILTGLNFSLLDSWFGSNLGKNLISPTLVLAQFFYSFSGDTMQVLGVSKDGFPLVRADSFTAEIRPSCSGYEGLVLIIIFLGFYFYYMRDRLKTAKRIGIVILALGSIFLLNGLRIALMMYLGAHVSAEVAVNGFHTNFGVFSLMLVITICMAAIAFFFEGKSPTRDKNAAVQPGESATREEAGLLLAPLMALLGSSILLGLFQGSFNWLYPVNVLIGALAFYPIRKQVVKLCACISPAPIVAGLFVFVVWITLIPEDSDATKAFAESLFGQPDYVLFTWIAFRVIGSSLVVPVAEEFAFRGVFWDYLDATFPAAGNAVVRHSVILLLTSAGFGLAHNDILAAIVAGLIYGLMRVVSAGVSAPAIAHMTTNAALSIYVLTLGKWSYW